MTRGVFRVTLPSGGTGIKVESLPGFPYEPVDWGKRKVGGAYGFLYAFDSLYMANMRGFYRIRDTDAHGAASAAIQSTTHRTSVVHSPNHHQTTRPFLERRARQLCISQLLVLVGHVVIAESV